MTTDQITRAALSLPEPERRSLVGTLSASLRTTRAGRAKVLAPCPRCGAQLGARERRKHRCFDPQNTPE